MSSPATSLRLNGFTREDRLTCTANLRDLIAVTCNGWITDFYQFSNISLTLHFEIPSEKLPLLAESLTAAKVALSSESEAALQHAIPSANPIIGTLQITFIHNERDLRRHVPAVPG